MSKGCALSTGYLPLGGWPRNSVDRITDRPYMNSAVDRGRKASTQTNKQNKILTSSFHAIGHLTHELYYETNHRMVVSVKMSNSIYNSSF